jgi:hypothetical protein
MAERESQVETVFSIASREAREGRSIEPVLANYPEHAAEVREMVGLATAIKSVPHPELPAEALERIRKRALSTLHSQQPSPVAPAKLIDKEVKVGRSSFGGFFTRFSPALYAAAGALTVLLVVGGVMLWNALMVQGIPGAKEVSSYSGIITSIDGPRWRIGDTEVLILIDDTTEIHGTPAVGAMMRCIGEELPGEHMKALEVWIEESPKVLPTVPTGPSGKWHGQRRLLTLPW